MQIYVDRICDNQSEKEKIIQGPFLTGFFLGSHAVAGACPVGKR